MAHRTKKMMFVLSLPVLFFILACSCLGTEAPAFDATKAVLEIQGTEMANRLTEEAQGSANPPAAGQPIVKSPTPALPAAVPTTKAPPIPQVVPSKTPTPTHTPTKTPTQYFIGVTIMVNPITLGATYINAQTGLCLDSNSGGSVYTMACNGGNYQNWRRVGDTLVNVETGLCLDSNSGGSVYTMACNGGNYQNWIDYGGPLMDAATGLCLDSNESGSVYTMACNQGNYQNWK